LDFLRLLKNAKALVGNSSAGIRECSYLGTPVINIGNRQHRRMRAENVTDVSYSQVEIEKAIKMAITSEKFESSTIYGNGDAGTKIADILATIELTFNKTITY